MTPQEALNHHLTQRPVSPGAVGADHPAFIAYHAALTNWTAKLDRLECAVRVLGVAVEGPKRTQPACTTKADYIYREPVKRRRNAA